MSWTFEVGQRFIVQNPKALGIGQFYKVGDTMEVVSVDSDSGYAACARGYVYVPVNVEDMYITPAIQYSWIDIGRELGFTSEEMYNRSHEVQQCIRTNSPAGKRSTLMDAILILHFHEKGLFDA